MTAALAIGLVALTVPALLINLCFTSLILGRWPRFATGLQPSSRAAVPT